MGDAAGKLTDRFELLCLEGELPRLLQFFLGFPALGYVAGDLGVADSVSFVITDGINNDMSPKPGSVLANAPSLFFEASVIPDGLKCQLRKARRSVLVCVETRKVLPDDFVCEVPFDPLRTKNSSW